MGIRDWPASEQPREKLLAKGGDRLSDAELLAIFLRTGTRGKSAVDLARDVLQSFGGLRQLLQSSQSEFCGIKGLGATKYVFLQAALELGQRYLEASLKRPDALSSPDDTRKFLISRLRGLPHEVFCVLFLDTKHRVLSFDEMFVGTIDGASVHPREVVKRALHHNAAAVIFAHNHPSGVAQPSRADELLTHRLRDALALVDIRVLDHFVVGDGEFVSLAERGLI